MAAKRIKKSADEAMQVSEPTATYGETEVDVYPTFRRLRGNESIDIAEFGLSYAHLSGDGVRVGEFASGDVSAVYPGAAVSARMNDFAIAALLLREIGTFHGEEVSFIRRVLELTQQQFAERCGLSRETINAFENGREPVTATVTSMIQRRFLPEALAALGRIADAFRNLDIRKFARLQAELDKKWAEGFTAARGVKLLLSHRPR